MTRLQLLVGAVAALAVTGCSRFEDLPLQPETGPRLSAVAAADLDDPAPRATASGATVIVLTANGMLLTVDGEDPSRVTARRKVSGLGRAKLLGIDFRPATGQLYGLGSDNRLYVIDPATGAATGVGAGFAAALTGDAFGFDFNPAVDRIRVVSSSGQNLRLHPDTGALVATDATLSYAAADANAGRTPGVVGAAYTNSDTDPNTGTTLYDIDATQDVLVTQIPPNDGKLNTVGPLGIDAESLVGFDILLAGPGTNVAYAAHKGSGNDASAEGGADSAPHLVRIDLGSGAATDLGKIHGAGRVVGLAVRP